MLGMYRQNAQVPRESPNIGLLCPEAWDTLKALDVDIWHTKTEGENIGLGAMEGGKT